jgi:hypothetical protein
MIPLLTSLLLILCVVKVQSTDSPTVILFVLEDFSWCNFGTVVSTTELTL